MVEKGRYWENKNRKEEREREKERERERGRERERKRDREREKETESKGQSLRVYVVGSGLYFVFFYRCIHASNGTEWGSFSAWNPSLVTHP